MTQTILIVDDDPVQRRLLEAAVTRMGTHAITAEGGREALDILEGPASRRPAVMILDLIMPQIDGMSVLQTMQEKGIACPVIVQTAQGGIETVVGAMRMGAFDFVVKPVSPDRLQTSIAKALRFETIQAAPERTRRGRNRPFTFRDIVSRDPAMERVRTLAEKAADSQIPVLIEGESGVGKELVARAIQGSGPRSAKPFITVNCGALPENLVESILFGHEKGAFTGATDRHVGKFEEANGGTLFLDEIGELPLDLQVKLLRAIQEGEIDPVGARKPVRIDVRLISATNRDLRDEVRAGRFREDLYYRLNVFPVSIPPLRLRRADIEPLVYHFIKRIAAEENKPAICAIEPCALSALRAHDWPGNIRELENAIFRAVVLCDGDELEASAFPQIISQLPGFDPAGETAGPEEPPMEPPGEPLEEPLEEPLDGETAHRLQVTPPPMETPIAAPPGSHPHMLPHTPDDNVLPATGTYGMIRMLSREGGLRQLDEVEADAISFAIEVCNGRMSEAARRLGIGRSTLYRKLKEYGLAEDTDTGQD